MFLSLSSNQILFKNNPQLGITMMTNFRSLEAVQDRKLKI